MIRICGVKGEVQDIDAFVQSILDFSGKTKVMVQALDADLVYGKVHLESAAEHAIRSMRQKSNTTNSLAMELLLYASGERQIKLSLEKMGVKKGKGNIAFVFIDGITELTETEGTISDGDIDEFLSSLNVQRDDTVLEGDEQTVQRFGISPKELQTITKAKYGQLILEKVAMVDLIK